MHFAHSLIINLSAYANTSKCTTICCYITKTTLKSANWIENSAKIFAHILHVLHLPRYTLNKILRVSCALSELFCKKICLTPLCHHMPRYIPSKEFKHVKNHTSLSGCNTPQFYELFSSHFIYHCCHKFLFLESSHILTYTYVKYSISWHQHKPSWMVKLCIPHNCYATIITCFIGHQPTWSLSLVMLPWPVPPL